MDSDLVYVKTASGEEAMQQRTRVMQRNVRMVLILVDGQSSVADLCAKTGNPQLTENALRDLEQGGFIEPRVEQDSLWAESKRVAQEIRAAVGRTPATGDSQPATPASAMPPADAAGVDERVYVHSVFPPSEAGGASLDAFASPPFAGGASPEPTPAPAPVSTAEPRESVRKPSWFQRFSARAESSAEPRDLPPRRRSRTASPASLLVGGLLVATILVVGIVLFYPYPSLVPKAEALLARAAGQPVKVADLQVAFRPSLGIRLSGVVIGEGESAVPIAEIRVMPDVASLFSQRKVIHEAVMARTTLPVQAMFGLSTLFREAGKANSPLEVRRIRFDDIALSFAGLEIPALSGDAESNADGSLKRVRLRSADGSLGLDATLAGQQLAVKFEGFGWRPVDGSPYVFDSVNLRATYAKGSITVSDMELRLFDGVISGVAVMPASGRPTVAGDIRYERLNAARLGDAVGLGSQFSGDLSGTLRFSASADRWSGIVSALVGDGEINLRRGSVRGIDLTEAVRRTSGTPVRGGSTQFESMTGKLKLSAETLRLSELSIQSGLMQSSGQVELGLGRDLVLRGKLDLRMRGSANQSRLGVSLSGPLRSPTVQSGGG